MEGSGEVLHSDFLAVGSRSNQVQQHLKRKRSCRANDKNPAESRTNQVQQRTERKGTRGDDKHSTKIANALNTNPQNEVDHILDTAAGCPIKRKYKGVSRSSTKFTAHFWLPVSTTNEKGRQVYIGSYDSLEKAARVHDLGALKYLGPKTELNFPVEDYSEEIEHMKQFSEEVYKDILHRESSGFCRGNSNYRGVFFQKGPGNWQARVHDVSEGKYLYVGTFDTKEEAAKAYDQAVLKLEKNQVTNFPRSNYEDFLQPSTTGNPDEVVQHLEETESEESDFQLLETYPTVTHVEEQPLFQLESIFGQSQPGLFGEQCQNTDQELEELVITACAFSPGFLVDSVQPAPDLVNQDNVGVSSLLPMPTVNDDGHLYCQWQEPEALIMTPHASCPGSLMDLVQPAQDMTFDDNIEISWFNEEMSAELPIPSVPDQSNGLLHIPDGYACNLDSQGYLIIDESRARQRSENAVDGPSCSTLSELLPFEDLEAFLLDDDYQGDLASPQRQIPLAHLPQNVENSRLPDPQNMTFGDNVDISWFNEEMSGELAIPSMQDQCNRLPKFPEGYMCSRDPRGYQIFDDSRPQERSENAVNGSSASTFPELLRLEEPPPEPYRPSGSQFNLLVTSLVHTREVSSGLFLKTTDMDSKRVLHDLFHATRADLLRIGEGHALNIDPAQIQLHNDSDEEVDLTEDNFEVGPSQVIQASHKGFQVGGCLHTLESHPNVIHRELDGGLLFQTCPCVFICTDDDLRYMLSSFNF